MMLLKPFDFTRNISINEIPPLYNFNKTSLLPEKFSDKLSTEKFKLVLHPKSNASAREWKTDHFKELIRLLPQDKIQFIITGGKTEKTFIDEWSKELPANVYNLAGKLLLDELISLLNSCDGIVAASTGPLHISAALGKYALGIFPPIRPIDPGRWAPVGYKSDFLVAAKSCSECRSVPENCHCINEISPEMVSQRVIQWLNK